MTSRIETAARDRHPWSEVNRRCRNHGSNMNNWGIFGSNREPWRRFPVGEQPGLGQERIVARHAEAPGPLALSRRPRGNTRTLPKSIVGTPAFSASNVLPHRPAQPAEIAQARVFERLLQTECAELRDLEHRAGPDDSEPSGELTQIRARLDEVDGLLRALQGRFPHSTPDGIR